MDFMFATSDQREPLGFGEFRFCTDRMRSNCNRLTIGAIRQYKRKYKAPKEAAGAAAGGDSAASSGSN